MFEDTESIISDPLKFKIKLSIGEDAYNSLRLKNKAYELWDALGAAGTAATIVKSAPVASLFFARSGLLAALGFGTATTPIGWVLAAAVISGGTWTVVSRYVKSKSNNKISVIPDFINTPMDVLALGLFDLMASLALKVASIDGHISDSEKHYIGNYFIKEWGYSEKFINDAILLTENNLSSFQIKDIALNLAEFQKSNPDCNFKKMSNEVLIFLTKVMESDGRIDEREELAIEKINNIFKDAGKINLAKSVKEKINSSSNFLKSTLKKRVLFSKNKES